MRLFFEKIFIILIIFIIIFIFLEFTLRITSSSNKFTPSLYPINLFDLNSPTTLKVDYIGKTAKSETQTKISINSIGCRDTEKKFKNEKIDILALGGSVVFGHGVDFENTFLKLTEKKLDNDINIYKCGVPGWNINNVKNFYENYYKNKKTDIVLLSIFIGNDLNFILNFNKISHSLALSKKTTLILKIKEFLRKNLFSYSFIVDSIKSNRILIKFLSKLNIATGFTRLNQIEIFTNEFYNKNSNNMNDLFKDIIYLKDHSQNLIVLLLPSKFQIDQNLLDNSIKKTNLQLEQIDKYLPNKNLINFFKKNDIMYMDVINKFEEMFLINKKIFFQIDEHYSHLGHKLLSIELVNFIKKNEKYFKKK